MQLKWDKIGKNEAFKGKEGEKKVPLFLLKQNQSKEAFNKMFRNLKARNKIRRKYLKVKTTRA